jgi:hypothetical protein
VVRRDISIRERLRKSAQRLRVTDQVILVLYCQERLLARLGSSQYRERFLLKGGLFSRERNKPRERDRGRHVTLTLSGVMSPTRLRRWPASFQPSARSNSMTAWSLTWQR